MVADSSGQRVRSARELAGQWAAACTFDTASLGVNSPRVAVPMVCTILIPNPLFPTQYWMDRLPARVPAPACD
jgi:hypothetical protein